MADRSRDCETAEPHGSGFIERQWRQALLLAAIVVVTVVARTPTFRFPLDQDCGVYYLCARTWAEGGLPYRDAWDHKPPAIYLLYLGLDALFQPSPSGVNAMLRWASAACDAGVVVALFFLVRRLVDAPSALVGAALYGLFAAAPLLRFEAFQPEQPALLLTICGFLAAVAYADRRRYPLVLLSGLLFGLALCFKQIVAPVGVATWAWLAWETLRERREGRLGRLIWQSLLLALGAVVPFGLFMAYFAARGALDNFLECTVLFNLHYTGEARRAGSLAGARLLATKMGPDHGAVWLAGLFGIVDSLRRTTTRRAGLLLLLWAAGAFLGLFACGQFARYYYIPPLAPMAAAAGATIVGLWRMLETREPLKVLLAAGAAMVLLGLTAFAAKRSYGRGGWRDVALSPRSTNVVAEDLARYIAKNTTPADRLYVWGGRAQLYVLSGRKNPCRYFYNTYFGMKKEEAYFYQPERLEEIISALRKHRPPFIVATELRSLNYFPALERYLDEGYDLVKTWEAEPFPFHLYRRRAE